MTRQDPAAHSLVTLGLIISRHQLMLDVSLVSTRMRWNGRESENSPASKLLTRSQPRRTPPPRAAARSSRQPPRTSAGTDLRPGSAPKRAGGQRWSLDARRLGDQRAHRHRRLRADWLRGTAARLCEHPPGCSRFSQGDASDNRAVRSLGPISRCAAALPPAPGRRSKGAVAVVWKFELRRFPAFDSGQFAAPGRSGDHLDHIARVLLSGGGGKPCRSA